MYSFALRSEYGPYSIEYSRGSTELQVLAKLGIPNTRRALHVYRHSASPCLKWEWPQWSIPVAWKCRDGNPPDQLALVEGSARGEMSGCLESAIGRLAR